jgi:hypothetical protein
LDNFTSFNSSDTGRINTVPCDIKQRPQLATKLVLAQKGTSASIASVTDQITAQLAWRATVDLDLHGFFVMKGTPTTEVRSQRVKVEGKGLLEKLRLAALDAVDKTEYTTTKPTDKYSKVHHLSFRKHGRSSRALSGQTDLHGQEVPYAWLSEDQGVGGNKGEEDELITFVKPEKVKYALIVANVWGDNRAKFCNYDGVIRVQAGSDSIEVPLTSTERGSWAIAALIDFTGLTPRVINIDETSTTEPDINDYINEYT